MSQTSKEDAFGSERHLVDNSHGQWGGKDVIWGEILRPPLFRVGKTVAAKTQRQEVYRKEVSWRWGALWVKKDKTRK